LNSLRWGNKLKKSGKRSVLFVIILIILLVSMAGFVSADVFIDTTDEDFGNGTLFKTNITGSGAGANVTLNITNFEFISHETSGNFTSRIFDTGKNITAFDRIAWSRVLSKSSDVLGYAMDTGVNDIGVFYRNGSLGTDNDQQNLFDAVLNFSSGLVAYSLPIGFSSDDIIGFAWDDDGSANIFAFFRNGSVLISNAQTNLLTDVSFTTTSTFTIPSGFNVSDIIGFAVNNDATAPGESAVFFKNSSYVRAGSEQPPFTYTTVLAYSLPLDFDVNDAIGIAYDRGPPNDIAMFFRNGSFVADVDQPNLASDIAFDTVVAATYPSGFDLITHTNITLQTRVSNDSITFTPWSRNYTNPDGSESIEDNAARYIQYKAVLETPDKYVTPFLENVSITTDSTPPNIIFNRPGDLANLSGTQVINVTVTDTLSQVDTVLFTLINESEIVLNMTPSQSGNDFNAGFDTTIFADGRYNITVFANDTQGNAGDASQVVNIDNTPPTIVVVKPSNNSFVVNGNQEVGFNITDLVSGIDTSSINSNTFLFKFSGFTFSVSSITFTPITNGFFVNGTVDLSNNEAEVNITVSAKDNAGNAIPTVSWSYVIDLLNPAVKDLSVNDSDNKVKDADSLNITVNATGGISGIASVSVSNSSSVAMSQLSTDLWSVTTTTSGLGCLSNGVCTVRVTATDNAGHVNDSETLALIVDNINPSVTNIITNDTDDKVKIADSVQINVTVNDANFDTGSTVTVGNASTIAMIKLSSTLWSVTTSGSALGCSATDGACTLTFTATDIVGNTNNSEKLTLTIDDTTPSVNSISINDSDNDVNNVTVLEIIINVTDTNAVTDVSINGAALSPLSGDLWSVVKETLDLCPGILDNTCSLDVTASDEVGNVNDSEKLTLSISSFAPVIANIPDITFDEDSHNDTVNLANFITDEDTLIGDITISALGNNSVIVKIDQTTKLLNVSAKENFNGQETLFFTASDGVHEVASNAVEVTVNPVNDVSIPLTKSVMLKPTS